MIGPPLGMADNDISRAEILDHRRRDIAGMGASLIHMAILGTKGDGAVGKHGRDRRQKGRRRADQQISRRTRLDTGGQSSSQRLSPGAQHIHLPVSGDQGTARHIGFFP